MSSIAQDLRKKDSLELEKIVIELKAKLLELRFCCEWGSRKTSYSQRDS